MKYIHGPELSSINAEKGKSAILSGLSSMQSFIFNQNLQSESIEQILSPEPALMHSPFYLPDLENALKVIHAHIKASKQIMLYGDRDSDGVTATAILALGLKKITAELHPASSPIFSVKTTSADDDYGLCPKCIESILAVKPDLLITIDFGSSNYNEINQLKQSGIDVIVLDHHEIPEFIPDSLLINPKRKDSIYPFKNICSAVLSFKLILALRFYLSKEFNKHYWIKIEQSATGQLIKNGVILFSGSLEDAKNNFPNDYYHYPAGLPQDNPERRIFFYQLNNKTEIFQSVSEYLALSSIGTITDLMLLIGENRIIVHHGLKELQRLMTSESTPIIGLKYLLINLALNPSKITAKDLGWTIGPAINAAGRMGKSEVALSLLLSEDSQQADILAKELIKINQDRKERTKRNLSRADNYFKNAETSHPIIFCYTADMEPGVSGIVASKLVSQFRKPAVFIAREKEYAKGSARAANGENILALIRKLDDHFIQFGGHQEAAGFSMLAENIERFKEELFKKSYNWQKEEILNIPPVSSMFRIQSFELTKLLFKEISLFEPFGQGNPYPLLSIERVKIINFKPMGNGEHASFKIQDSDIKFVIWNTADELEKAIAKKPDLSLWGNLEENFFNSRSFIQFSVAHFE